MLTIALSFGIGFSSYKKILMPITLPFSWGGDGWTHIQHHMETIEELSNKIMEILEPFISRFKGPDPSQIPLSAN